MIVITGAGDGLELQIVRVYKEAGKRVANLSRRASEHADDNILTDLSDEAPIAAATQKSAGVLSVRPLGKITVDQVDRTFGVNIRAAILLVSGLADRIKADRTDIVNMASTVGTKAYPDQEAYGASKWAMRGFSRNLQIDLKATNRVINFCIGGLKSDIDKKATGKILSDPENRIEPADIAVFVKQILKLRKNVEASEIIINRRPLA